LYAEIVPQHSPATSKCNQHSRVRPKKRVLAASPSRIADVHAVGVAHCDMWLHRVLRHSCVRKTLGAGVGRDRDDNLPAFGERRRFAGDVRRDTGVQYSSITMTLYKV
jgi:hypothetical protein